MPLKRLAIFVSLIFIHAFAIAQM
ncbi:MAG: hypothetical protein RL158_1091, partial [Bacteroidota bacterium]